MKAQIIFASLLALATRVVSDDTHPCVANAVKVSKLATCSTATPFCSRYLHGSATYTRTATVTSVKYAKTILTTQTIISDSTVYTSTRTLYDTTSTFSTDTTTTVTTTQASCPQGQRRRDLEARAAVPSCGIASNAAPSEVSGACNCILASSTTSTQTVVLPKTTTTAKTTTISTFNAVTTTVVTPVSTEYTTTSTSTACATPTAYFFTLSPGPSYISYEAAYEGGDYTGALQDVEGGGVVIKLIIADGTLQDSSGNTAYLEYETTNNGAGNVVVFRSSDPSGDGPLHCNIDGGTLNCGGQFYDQCSAPWHDILFFGAVTDNECEAVTLTVTQQ